MRLQFFNSAVIATLKLVYYALVKFLDVNRENEFAQVS